MQTSGNLSLEQQFKLKVLQEQVQGLSLDEAQKYLVEVLRQGMVKDNILRQWMKQA